MVSLHTAAMIDGKRFGLEFQEGLAHNEESVANKNAFTIDGKLFKLGIMHIVEGMHSDNNPELRSLKV